jgi:arylformamidase
MTADAAEPGRYRGMTQAALDAAYDNVAADPDFAATYARFRAQSAAFYAARPAKRDLAYGPTARERFDWLPCGRPDAPTLVFIHGGYWQRCDKEDFAFVAHGALERGFHVALAEYTLAPAATMTRIVAETGRLLDALACDAARLGSAGRPLYLAGHSAGGHLSALWRAHPAVSGVLPISALVDLEPIALTRLNDALHLDADEIARYSPLRVIGPGAPLTIAVGARELPELVRHSVEYAAECLRAGQQASYLPLAGHTHFTVLDDLANPDGALLTALARMIASTP